MLVRSMMPSEERGEIGEIKPSGWNQAKYPGLVDSDPPFLYNRCHLIAYALTGQEANEKNLITGTRYMNIEGMFPFEGQILPYLYRPGARVIYRVKPRFYGDELVARGVEMEAFSVGDSGSAICFHVYVFNVQPGVEIDYTDGSSQEILADSFIQEPERRPALLKKSHLNTVLFIGFLLLGGFLHSNDPDPYHFTVSVIYCSEYLIYAGLIFSWMQSIGERLLPSRSKRYLQAIAWLMLLFLATQFTKYRIAVMPGLTRYCWYVYYLPLLLIPALFWMTCIRLGRGSNRGKINELGILLPALLLALGVLTNDFHMLAFRPNEEIAGLTGAPNTYTHGFLFYAAYAWAGFAMAAGLFFLLAAFRKKGRWKRGILLLAFLVLIPPLMVLCKQIPKNSIPITFEWPEAFIFCMLGVLEACIRSHLIPSNVNYGDYFSRIDLPVLITDKELEPVFQTQAPVRAAKEQLKESLTAPVYTDPDTRLSGREIRAGYTFRTEDESTVNRLNKELRDANEILLQENEILEREQELAAEQAGIEERSRLYQKAAQEVYPVQKKISGILEKAQPGTNSFRPDIEKALVLTAYVKRKANFVLVEAERETVSAKELASALEESAHYLRYCGLNAVVDVQAERAFPCRMAMAVYDCFEAAAEGLSGKTDGLFIRLQDHELMIMAEGAGLPVLSGLPIPVRQSCEDGQLVLRFDLGGAV